MHYLAILGCYLIGGIPFGLFLARCTGIDIREHGSGNIGATNVGRICGPRWGLTCLALDALKGLLPVLAVKYLAASMVAAESISTTNAEWLVVASVFAAVAGHVWSPYLKFTGGKGIATSAGALLGIACYPLLIALVVWGVTFYTSRYVSLASILAAAVLPVSAFALNPLLTTPYPAPVLIVLTALGVLAIARHHTNIVRLLNGTEVGLKKKKDKTDETSST